MRVRKSLFVGLSLMFALVALPQMGDAQRIVVRSYAVRPYAVYGFGWGPAWYSPYYYPGYYPVAVGPRDGEVKIETHVKDASIYVDGGFAGTTGKLKHFSLKPGNHDIEVRNTAGQALFHDHVQVLVGRTVEIKL
jgi:hypothetical protein